MPTAPPVIRNSSHLVDVFGCWPSFHDAEIHRAELDRGDGSRAPSVTLVIHVFDSDGTVDERGYFVTRVSVLATMRFNQVDDVAFSDLQPQNVLFGLGIDAQVSGRYLITLEPSYGLWGSFTCADAEILAVRPWPGGEQDVRRRCEAR